MKNYYKFYYTKSYIVSFLRFGTSVEVIICNKKNSMPLEIAKQKHGGLSDLQALKLTRLNFNI